MRGKWWPCKISNKHAGRHCGLVIIEKIADLLSFSSVFMVCRYGACVNSLDSSPPKRKHQNLSHSSLFGFFFLHFRSTRSWSKNNCVLLHNIPANILKPIKQVITCCHKLKPPPPLLPPGEGGALTLAILAASTPLVIFHTYRNDLYSHTEASTSSAII